ncbi:MAG: bifunctional oligoribonuclease/PAP phosphatase NrnA [Lachnospiraceae bacterium]|nr:bifunctional oligoribonuclease/PAP phosphatase NrnA [Lachnospiraceae bacterium]
MERLLEHIGDAKKIGISGHVNPDGDCVGSCLAVYNFLREKCPELDIQIFLNPIPTIFSFLAGASDIQQADENDNDRIFDLYISLDCGDTSRLGPAGTYFRNAKRRICIDHHLGSHGFADWELVDSEASSTCELVFDLIEPSDISIAVAECIYTGMVTDTGVFQYSCTHSSTMKAAGFLMDLGIDYPRIVERVFYEKTFEQNQIMGRALLNARRYLDNRCIASVITKKEMDEFGVLPKHMEGIVSQLRVTRDAEVSIFLYETENYHFKVSLRSSDLVNVAEIAAAYGGGGHAKAAGCGVQGDPWKAIDTIVKKVKQQLN